MTITKLKHVIGIKRHKTNIQTIYIIKCMFIPMHDLPLLTFQQHNTYGIMYKHMNVCTCYQNKENNKQTLTLTCDSKPSKQTCETETLEA